MAYEIRNMDRYNPDWQKGNNLVWKKVKSNKKTKQFNTIEIAKIVIPDGAITDLKILEDSRKQYAETHKLVPVYLSYDFRLMAGYEQIILAKELGYEQIPFQRVTKMNRKEAAQFRKTVHDRPVGNKKIPVKDTEGNKIYLTYREKKILNRCYKMARILKMQLKIMPGMKITLLNSDKTVHRQGMSLKAADRNLRKLTNETGTKTKKKEGGES